MEPISLLSPRGEYAARPDVHLDVTAAMCADLYQSMRIARRFDEECQHLQRQGQLGLWLSCAGQEAAQVGSVSALAENDHVFPSYREHAAALRRGVSPAEIMTQWRGCRHSGWSPRKHRFHIYTLVLAAQTLHATGYAMGLQRSDTDDIAVVYLGDGASSEGDASEAFNWAAVTGAPVLFVCQNNGLAISTPTSLQMRTPLHERAAGFGLHTALVDGNDVLAMRAVTEAMVARVRSGSGPALIEAVTYRMAGHSTADDPTRYRSDSEVRTWRERDPLSRLELFMRESGWLSDEFVADIEELCHDIAAQTRQACPTLAAPSLQQLQESVLAPAPVLSADAPRTVPQPPDKPATLAKALNLGLKDAMADDPQVLVMGQDVGVLGGVFRVTDGLRNEFGADRVIDTPLAESGIVGTAIGLALRGFRPVCEIQFDGFVYPAFNQIVSQLAKMRARTLGEVSLPVVIRIPVGGGIGAVEHHSESNEAYFAHTAGLRVVYCTSPDDAYWLLRQAIECDDPVIFYEPKRLYYSKAVAAPLGAESLPIDAARIVRTGDDVTVVSYGAALEVCRRAADVAADSGIQMEVIEARSIAPLDIDTIVASVRRTQRAVVVHEASVYGGFGGEIAQQISERCFLHLEAPVSRVGGWDMPYPPAKVEHLHLPDVDRILDAVEAVVAY